jgi:crescentin
MRLSTLDTKEIGGGVMDNLSGSIKKLALTTELNPQDQQELRDPPGAAVSPSASCPGDAREVLDATGRRNEMLRVGLSQVFDRIDEIARLKEDFGPLIVDPVMTLISDYPQVQAKLLETEEALTRERETAAELRRELRDIKIAHEKLSDSFAALTTQHQDATQVIREHETQAASLQVALREHEQRVTDLERQLGAETERARTTSEELQTVRRDAEQADAAVARLERDLAEARETLEILQFDNETLRTTSTEQGHRLSTLEARHAELEQQHEAAQDLASELQTKLETEHNLRKKLEAQLETERTNSRVEIAALEMKVEGITSRMGVTEKILSHAREQLRDKTDELKSAERIAKDALIEKNTLERRLEAAHQDLERQSALATESNELRTELTERCDMLGKAIAAKDSLLQRADHRTGMLLDRIDQLTRKFDEERGALEARNKKLWEDLQREKSERALAQGALETARRGRVESERELARIQRSRRPGAADSDDPGSNVTAFKASEG